MWVIVADLELYGHLLCIGSCITKAGISPLEEKFDLNKDGKHGTIFMKIHDLCMSASDNSKTKLHT